VRDKILRNHTKQHCQSVTKLNYQHTNSLLLETHSRRISITELNEETVGYLCRLHSMAQQTHLCDILTILFHK